MDKRRIKKREFIPLKKAAHIFGYSRNYLSSLANEGKLKAIKIGGEWMTTENWMRFYIKKKNPLKDRKYREKKAKKVESEGSDNPLETYLYSNSRYKSEKTSTGATYTGFPGILKKGLKTAFYFFLFSCGIVVILFLLTLV